MKNIELMTINVEDFDDLYPTLDNTKEYLLDIANAKDSEWESNQCDLIEFFEKRVSSCGYYFYKFLEGVNPILILKGLWNLQDKNIESVKWTGYVFNGDIFCLNGLPVAFSKNTDEDRYLAFPKKLVSPIIPEIPKDLTPEQVLNFLEQN